ncbi:hypothetical protein ACU52_06810 [Xylanibacter rarus]|uniref:Uncharacterized protein n=1 Tax=Xylanibacter rarus TaxID=1676614 RepID=A0A8E1QXT9_9BACT|nr:hypothetical protein ACU52_06810 [Xylanibacter rarus]
MRQIYRKINNTYILSANLYKKRPEIIILPAPGAPPYGIFRQQGERRAAQGRSSTEKTHGMHAESRARQAAVQKATFRIAKGALLQPKRRPFAS